LKNKQIKLATIRTSTTTRATKWIQVFIFGISLTMPMIRKEEEYEDLNICDK
jgi:hypothetical protein